MWGLEGKRFWLVLAVFVIGLAAIICYRGLPDTVYGALVALGGVILTTLHSGAMRQADLNSTVLLKKIEREMGLRREVFLPAFEGATSALNAIAALLESSKARDEISGEFAAGITSFSKAMLVAAPPTVAGIQRLAGALNLTWNECNAHRVVLDQIRDHYKAIERERELEIELRQTAIKQRQIVQMQRNADIQSDMRAFVSIRAHEERIAALNAQLVAVTLERDTRYVSALKPLIKRLAEIRPLFPPVLAELRREMELPFDESAFAKAQEALTSEVLEIVGRRVAEAEQRLAAQREQVTGPAQVANEATPKTQ
ncbi:hypothetical protein [Ralstonia mojiangensis]|uniref:hypothetical protein n=1 Tax=Ralstonia mojiangensis TaxID=2953895 RepID=UPI0020908AC0|nr:hypothetical protein [Ralstonia mojiangensis]MCO5411102.1 hypothetical protein [Ralstonia mojiangensis]